MKMELLNPYVIKILISLREKDSISSVSRRINLSYGWTNKWINELVNDGILVNRWRGFELNKENRDYKNILKFIRENLNDISFYYSALSLFGINYCFTKTDAVYVWTEGRYNIARYKGFYPIFIKIQKQDYRIFLEYCRKLGLNVNSKKGIFYNIEISERLKSVRKDGLPVESLDETIRFMRENIYNFEPALEMINEMYSKRLNVKYKEVNYL